MVLWHRTSAAALQAILAGGFIDGVGTYMLENTILRGVFLSDQPMGEADGVGREGDPLLRVLLDASEAEISAYELVENGKPWREWCIPAGFVNARSRLDVLSEAEEDEMKVARMRQRLAAAKAGV